MKVLSYFIALTLVGILCFFIGAEHSRRTIEAVQPVTILNAGQLQEVLNALEPENPLAIDYKPGKKTLTKWDRVYNNLAASTTF